MYGWNGRVIWRRFESGKCTSSISMIKGFGWAETNSTLWGPGLKGTVHCLQGQQTCPGEVLHSCIGRFIQCLCPCSCKNATMWLFRAITLSLFRFNGYKTIWISVPHPPQLSLLITAVLYSLRTKLRIEKGLGQNFSMRIYWYWSSQTASWSACLVDLISASGR